MSIIAIIDELDGGSYEDWMVDFVVRVTTAFKDHKDYRAVFSTNVGFFTMWGSPVS